MADTATPTLPHLANMSIGTVSSNINNNTLNNSRTATLNNNSISSGAKDTKSDTSRIKDSSVNSNVSNKNNNNSIMVETETQTITGPALNLHHHHQQQQKQQQARTVRPKKSFENVSIKSNKSIKSIKSSNAGINVPTIITTTNSASRYPTDKDEKKDTLLKKPQNNIHQENNREDQKAGESLSSAPVAPSDTAAFAQHTEPDYFKDSLRLKKSGSIKKSQNNKTDVVNNINNEKIRNSSMLSNNGIMNSSDFNKANPNNGDVPSNKNVNNNYNSHKSISSKLLKKNDDKKLRARLFETDLENEMQTAGFQSDSSETFVYDDDNCSSSNQINDGTNKGELAESTGDDDENNNKYKIAEKSRSIATEDKKEEIAQQLLPSLCDIEIDLSTKEQSKTATVINENKQLTGKPPQKLETNTNFKDTTNHIGNGGHNGTIQFNTNDEEVKTAELADFTGEPISTTITATTNNNSNSSINHDKPYLNSGYLPFMNDMFHQHGGADSDFSDLTSLSTATIGGVGTHHGFFGSDLKGHMNNNTNIDFNGSGISNNNGNAMINNPFLSQHYNFITGRPFDPPQPIVQLPAPLPQPQYTANFRQYRPTQMTTRYSKFKRNSPPKKKKKVAYDGLRTFAGPRGNYRRNDNSSTKNYYYNGPSNIMNNYNDVEEVRKCSDDNYSVSDRYYYTMLHQSQSSSKIAAANSFNAKKMRPSGNNERRGAEYGDDDDAYEGIDSFGEDDEDDDDEEDDEDEDPQDEMGNPKDENTQSLDNSGTIVLPITEQPTSAIIGPDNGTDAGGLNGSNSITDNKIINSDNSIGNSTMNNNKRRKVVDFYNNRNSRNTKSRVLTRNRASRNHINSHENDSNDLRSQAFQHIPVFGHENDKHQPLSEHNYGHDYDLLSQYLRNQQQSHSQTKKQEHGKYNKVINKNFDKLYRQLKKYYPGPLKNILTKHSNTNNHDNDDNNGANCRHSERIGDIEQQRYAIGKNNDNGKDYEVKENETTSLLEPVNQFFESYDICDQQQQQQVQSYDNQQRLSPLLYFKRNSRTKYANNNGHPRELQHQREHHKKPSISSSISILANLQNNNANNTTNQVNMKKPRSRPHSRPQSQSQSPAKTAYIYAHDNIPEYDDYDYHDYHEYCHNNSRGPSRRSKRNQYQPPKIHNHVNHYHYSASSSYNNRPSGNHNANVKYHQPRRYSSMLWHEPYSSVSRENSASLYNVGRGAGDGSGFGSKYGLYGHAQEDIESVEDIHSHHHMHYHHDLRSITHIDRNNDIEFANGEENYNGIDEEVEEGEYYNEEENDYHYSYNDEDDENGVVDNALPSYYNDPYLYNSQANFQTQEYDKYRYGGINHKYIYGSTNGTAGAINAISAGSYTSPKAALVIALRNFIIGIIGIVMLVFCGFMFGFFIAINK